MKNPYEELDVDVDAMDPAIKKAYRSKSMILHPDHGGDADAFADLAEAYRILMDPDERDHYDRTGERKDRVKPLDKEASSVIGIMFQSAVDQLGESIFRTNIVQDMKFKLMENVSMCVRQKREEAESIEHLQKIMTKIGDPEKSPVFAACITTAINSHKTKQDYEERKKQVAELAISMLDDYNFDQDQAPEATYNFTGSWLEQLYEPASTKGT